MFSFSTLSVAATIALSAFTSALPLSGRDVPLVGGLPVVGDVVDGLTKSLPGVGRDLPVVGSLPVVGDLTSAVSGIPVVGSVLRRDAPQSVAAILTQAHEQLLAPTDQLSKCSYHSLLICNN